LRSESTLLFLPFVEFFHHQVGIADAFHEASMVLPENIQYLVWVRDPDIFQLLDYLMPIRPY
jgi:hypothetical protein